MSNNADNVIIVSTSARALASLAQRSQLVPLTIDAFADADTRSHALESITIPLHGFDLDADALLSEVRCLKQRHSITGLIYGSGLGAQPDVIARLADCVTVYGNRPDVLEVVKSPGRFTQLLDRLEIPHAPTRLTPPADTAGWLCKDAHGCGGTHVHYFDRCEEITESTYFQQFTDGTVMSVLFLADGKSAFPVGWNCLFSNAGSQDQPFRYGGAISRVSLRAELRDRLLAYVGALVKELGLIGLNGMDFIVDQERLSILEVNPHPTATVELHDPDYAQGLIALHIDACRHRHLPAYVPSSLMVRAQGVIYADQDVWCPQDLTWPAWCADLPAPASHIREGQPVCSVMVRGQSVSSAGALLRWRMKQAKGMLDALSEPGCDPIGLQPSSSND